VPGTALPVPATGFYEWTKDAEGNRLPWYFTPADGEPLVLAGIWQAWEKGDSPLVTVAVVTCAASDWMAETTTGNP
jgi:putative SOS response-associated peptidase YedK